MLNVIKIYPKAFASNCYLVTADGTHAVAIDPAQPRVLEEAQKRGLKVEYALLTHGHFDHIGGCAALQNAGAKIGCLVGEERLALGKDNLSLSMGGCPIAPFTIDFTVKDGERFTLCNIPFTAMATPGHTAGSACYFAEDCLFSGDTLFCDGVGRTDLPTGSGAALSRSLKKLFTFNQNYKLYAGHGEDGTLFYERDNNGWRYD